MTSLTSTFEYWLETGADDATWVLGSAFMILTMQSGFGLLESGSLPARFEANIMMKNVTDVLFGGLSFWMFGYGLSRGDSWRGIVGTTKFFTDQGSDLGTLSSEPMDTFSHYIFQFAFASTATTIVSGAVAGRMNFRTYMVFSFFNTISYCVTAHWVFHSEGWLHQLGTVDFAGDGPVHVFGAVNALVAAWMVGSRPAWLDAACNSEKAADDFLEDRNPSNCISGLFMLWWGWIGFNCGSTFGTTEFKWLVACRVGVTTVNGSIGGGLFGVLASLILSRKYGFVVLVEDVVNGTLAGLVAITGPCAVVSPLTAFFVGGVGSICCTVCNNSLSHYRLVDDPVGAIGVHGAAGIWGLLSAGLFSDSSLISGQSRDGLFHGGGFELLGIQALGTMCQALWAMLSSAVLLKLLDLGMGLRASSEDISVGFDWSEHRLATTPKSAEVESCELLETQVAALRGKLEELSAALVALQRHEATSASISPYPAESTSSNAGLAKQDASDEKLESKTSRGQATGDIHVAGGASDNNTDHTLDIHPIYLIQKQPEDTRGILQNQLAEAPTSFQDVDPDMPSAAGRLHGTERDASGHASRPMLCNEHVCAEVSNTLERRIMKLEVVLSKIHFPQNEKFEQQEARILNLETHLLKHMS